jgi:hypothetical protein
MNILNGLLHHNYKLWILQFIWHQSTLWPDLCLTMLTACFPCVHCEMDLLQELCSATWKGRDPVYSRLWTVIWIFRCENCGVLPEKVVTMYALSRHWTARTVWYYLKRPWPRVQATVNSEVDFLWELCGTAWKGCDPVCTESTLNCENCVVLPEKVVTPCADDCEQWGGSSARTVWDSGGTGMADHHGGASCASPTSPCAETPVVWQSMIESINQSTNLSVNKSINVHQWDNQSISDNNQSVNVSISQWINQSKNVNESINEYQSISQWIDQCQPISQSMSTNVNQSINQSMNQTVYESINQGINQSMNQSVYKSVNEPISQWINQSMNQSINQWINRSINQSINDMNQSMNSVHQSILNETIIQ